MSAANGSNGNGNGTTKTIGLVIAILAIMGSLAGIMTQYVQHSDEKNRIWRENILITLQRLERKLDEIEHGVHQHREDPNIHAPKLNRLDERLEGLTKEVDELKTEQSKQRVYRK